MLFWCGFLFCVNELEDKICVYNIKFVLDECVIYDDFDKLMEQYLMLIKELLFMDYEDVNSQVIRVIGFVRECLVVLLFKEVMRFYKRMDKKFDEFFRELIYLVNLRGEGVNRDGFQCVLNYEVEKFEKRGFDDWFWQMCEYLEILMEY